MAARAALLLLASVLATGCATAITPPPGCADDSVRLVNLWIALRDGDITETGHALAENLAACPDGFFAAFGGVPADYRTWLATLQLHTLTVFDSEQLQSTNRLFGRLRDVARSYRSHKDWGAMASALESQLAHSEIQVVD